MVSILLNFLILSGWATVYSEPIGKAPGVNITGAIKCGPGDVPCDDGRCILQKWWCDGQKDCRDGSDEKGCSPKKCETSQHLCDGTRCVPIEWRCDGSKDCQDGSDEEAAICDRPCPENFWRCPTSNRCITLHWRCDGENDCKDGEDEDPQLCSDFEKCPVGEKLCADKSECVTEILWCDGDADCKDGSDENILVCRNKSLAGSFDCGTGTFRCVNGTCINETLICDGTADCIDGEDEILCNNTVAVSLSDPGTLSKTTQPTNTSTVPCPAGDFVCKDGECISPMWRCDGEIDCGDGSDEHNCQSNAGIATMVIHLSTTACKSSEIFCILNNGSEGCLPLENVCDQRMDCRDGADEGAGCLTPCKEDNELCSYKCHPTPHGPQCSCPLGYRLNSDGKTCDDINECASSGFPFRQKCDQICINKPGSYECQCVTNFTLDSNGYSCKVDQQLVSFDSANETEIPVWETEDCCGKERNFDTMNTTVVPLGRFGRQYDQAGKWNLFVEKLTGYLNITEHFRMGFEEQKLNATRQCMEIHAQIDQNLLDVETLREKLIADIEGNKEPGLLDYVSATEKLTEEMAKWFFNILLRSSKP